MTDLTITTLCLATLAVVSATASALAIRGVRPDQPKWKSYAIEKALIAVCAAGGVALESYRVLYVHQGWRVLENHVDGLVIVATLLSMALFEMRRRSRLLGLAAFAMPAHTFVVLWAVCASAWTYREFRIDSLVAQAHRGGIYLGTFCAFGAASGGMLYLFAKHRLRTKRRPTSQTPLASLEAIERFVRRLATVGFVLITTGVLLGVFVASTTPTRLGPVWWRSPKIVLAAAAWLTYAVIAYGGYAKRLRIHTAWLSIVGLILVLATFGIVGADSARSVAIRYPIRATDPADTVNRFLPEPAEKKVSDDTRRSP